MVGVPPAPPSWRRSALAEGLAEPLRRLRVAARAGDATIVYAPGRSKTATRIIAVDPPEASAFITDEPVHCELQWRSDVSVQPVTLISLMRDLRAHLEHSVVVPFADENGCGWVILGSASLRWAGDIHNAHELGREIRRLQDQIGQSRHRDIDRAYRIVARAATSDLSLDRVFDITLAAARNLVSADVAYMSLPVDDQYFVFNRTLGIKTDGFRSLRIGLGEGLGGAARAAGHALRSLNYRDDHNLRSAPREETQREGIYSALAVPVRDGSDVVAVLYVGSRQPRAYSEDDEHVLTDFANATLLGLDRSDLDESRRSLVREQERARLARTLHDDLVRRLTQIGFTAEELENSSTGTSKSHAEAISATVTECMTLLRGELHGLLRGQGDRASTLGEVAERIFAVPTLSGMERTASFPRDGSGLGAQIRVPADVAEAMCRVGQEAVFNAENHSGGSRCGVSFEMDGGTCVMSICDDGPDMDSAAPVPGHHGLSFMKQEVRRVGGTVEMGRSPLGGLSVRAHFPIDIDEVH